MTIALSNLHWYGWIAMFFAIGSTLDYVATVLDNRTRTGGQVEVGVHSATVALCVVVTLWLMLP